MAAVGTWNPLGFNLPDYKITERLGIGAPNPAFQTGLTSGVSTLTNNSRPVETPPIGPPASTLSGNSFNNSVNSGAIRVDSGPQVLGEQNTGGGGGGGGGGDSELQQLAKTDRNGPQEDRYQQLLREMQSGAQNQAQIELDNALSEYDRQAEGLQAQSGQLDQQRESALNTLSGKQTEAMNEAGRAKQEAQDTTQTATRKLLSTAQDVQKSNRNVLRALGILSSSAAGEMLNKPLNEYQTQAGELQQGLVKRISVVEDWLMSRQNEFAQSTKDLENQYATLKENINRDLRFNARDRVSAVKAAGAALQQRTQEIEQQSLQYANAAKQYSDNLLMQIAQIQMYQNPTADTSGILNTLLSNAQSAQKTITSGTVQTEEQRKKLSGLG